MRKKTFYILKFNGECCCGKCPPHYEGEVIETDDPAMVKHFVEKKKEAKMVCSYVDSPDTH